MGKISVSLLAISILAGCASAPPAPDAKSVVIANEAKTSMVDFRDLREYPGNVTCGSYQVTSKWGESGGFREFMVRGDELDLRLTEEEKAIYCTAEPRQAFEDRFGITPTDKSNNGLIKFKRDYIVLRDALTQYETDMGKLPTASEGLDMLVNDDNRDMPAKYRANGYLKELPLDFWGRDYIYEPSRWGGVKIAFTISTLGADGAVGGRGPNADINSKLIPYLEHLDSL